ncbi:hypothetical protein P152DRAFT_472151 [Eremomyces bilateralis CBS 781.70]|uniref:Ribosomal protein n=1 Tax=Eremomyces bilateralis CBS 781.70 TaxID=1392243 RepID=A0A6G1G904_9PEZI|nr:uncharacterized protein P152DRAFT_472151 [Eremomyces bilateralis CBS 781.70]KAF1814380.1 hypothetical protein P152DRAFT_472151 [Eremomyces bilateralis CBS 781.70]
MLARTLLLTSRQVSRPTCSSPFTQLPLRRSITSISQTLRFPRPNRPSQFLSPSGAVEANGTSIFTTVGQRRGMKVRTSVKKLCDGCKSVRRKKKYVYIICSKNPKHKQRQG